MYHDTVGNNAVLELDFAIDRDGLVNPTHATMYTRLGQWIQECYATPIVPASYSTKKVGDTTWEYTLVASAASAWTSITTDRVVMREDYSKGGQYVRSWKLSVNGNATASGTSIGNRKVSVFETLVSAPTSITMVLTVTAVAEPNMLQFDMFHPCRKE